MSVMNMYADLVMYKNSVLLISL